VATFSARPAFKLFKRERSKPLSAKGAKIRKERRGLAKSAEDWPRAQRIGQERRGLAKSAEKRRGQLLAEHNGHRLVIRLDDGAHRLPLIEGLLRHRKTHENCSLDFLAGLQLGLRHERGL